MVLYRFEAWEAESAALREENKAMKSAILDIWTAYHGGLIHDARLEHTIDWAVELMGGE